MTDGLNFLQQLILILTPVVGGMWVTIQFLVNKKIITANTFKKKEVIHNDITPKIDKRRELMLEEVAVLKNHPVFSDLEMIRHHHLDEIYSKSKQKLPQLLFITQLQYVFAVHHQDCLTALARVEKNLDAPKNLVIKTLIATILLSKENVDCLIREKGIKMSVASKFNVWYNEHFSWYFPMIELLTLDATDYYKELDIFLNLTRTFMRAVLTSAQNHIDVFNGEITSDISEEELSKIDFGAFNKYLDNVKQ